MIDKIEKLCCGCGACLNICPADAIKMPYIKTNFYTPIVNKKKCIKCGKCINVCPAIKYKSPNTQEPLCYAVSANDEERKKSTSGAFFPVLAKYILQQDGYVCGVAWNKKWETEHILINREIDLQKIRISKYVQSKIGICFRKIKNLLDSEKLVLFSGTPCQNAGLLNFLGKKYDNLITVDILCHGIPSPRIWQDYLDKNFNRNEIININFRKKIAGWAACNETSFNNINACSIDTIDGKQTPIGIFYEAFIKHRLSNESCIDCKYKKVKRPADFTMGDFWHFYHDKKLDDGLGLSVLLLNNQKALEIFSFLKKNFKLVKEISIKNHYDWAELLPKDRNTKERPLLFNHYLKGFDVNTCINEALGKHYDIGLCTMVRGINYGSSLVAYSTYKILDSLNKSVLMINKKIWEQESRFDIVNEFMQKYYPNISRKYEIQDDYSELNNLVDTFIVGSDTLWQYKDIHKTGNFFWLDFANDNKGKISFCTSFAHDIPDIPKEKYKELELLYKRFDAISARESSGTKNLKELFGVKRPVHLYDPTLIVNPQIFKNISNASKRKDKNYILAYILDLTEEKEKMLNYIKKISNKELKVIPAMYYNGDSKIVTEKGVSIEDFVYLIKNADFVITNSFHGTCFSIIFEIPFYALINNERGSARWQIFRNMHLSNRLIDDINLIYKYRSLNYNIDFSYAKQKIIKEREKAIKWLNLALANIKQKT